MKNSGIKWIGEIPNKWSLAKFKNVAEIYNGNSINDNEKEKYYDNVDAVPYISSKDIKANSNTVNYKTGLYIKSNDSNFKKATANSSIMCIEGGSAGIKKAILSEDVAFVNKLCCFKPHFNFDSKFLFYCLNNLGYENEFQKYISGLIGGVNINTIKNIKLPVPPENEQKRIGLFLDEIITHANRIVGNEQQLIEKLMEYRQSIITEAVTKGLHDVPMKDSGIEWIGEIPEHWKIIKIKWLLSERKERSEEGSEEPLSMSQKYGIIPTKDMEMIPNMASSFVGAKLVISGDLVFNKLKAHLGVFSVSKYSGLVSPDYAVYSSTKEANAKFLEFLFKTPQYINEFKKKSSGVGAGLTRLYTSDLYSIYCGIPSISEQQEIADYLDEKCAAIDKLIAEKEQVIAKLDEYKKCLIYECVTGKRECGEVV